MKKSMLIGLIVIGIACNSMAQIAGPRWTYSPADLGGTIQENIESLESRATVLEADGAIGTDNLADEAVTTGKIDDDAVTTGKIAANAVTTADIIDGAITEAKLQDAASGLNIMRYGRASWSFAANGGATNSDTGGGSLSCAVPSGAIIWDGFVSVDTPITPTNSIFSFGINGTNRDLLAMTTLVASARNQILPTGTSASSLKATNNLLVRYYITTVAATAGSVSIFFSYFQ